MELFFFKVAVVTRFRGNDLKWTHFLRKESSYDKVSFQKNSSYRVRSLKNTEAVRNW